MIPDFLPTCLTVEISLEGSWRAKNICGILSCESGEMFLQFFRQYLNQLFSSYLSPAKNPAVPDDFLLNHISGSFVNMIQWWIWSGTKETPEELAAYFDTVTRPVLAGQEGI